MKQNKNELQKTRTLCRYGLLFSEETCKSSFRTDFSRPPKTIFQISPTDIFLQIDNI